MVFRTPGTGKGVAAAATPFLLLFAAPAGAPLQTFFQ